MKTLLLSLVLLFSVCALKATHNRSGEILYKRIAPFSTVTGGVTVPVFTYSITLITYTDDGPSIADRCEDTIYFGDGQKAIAPRVNFPGTSGSFSNCGCGSGVGCGNIIMNEANYRVKKNVFSTTHTYSGTGNYIVSFLDPNRNASIVNIPNSVNQPFYVEALIMVTNSVVANTSPNPTNPPIDKGFVSSCFYHNPAAFDADGDSISYELMACNAPGATLPATGTGGSLGIDARGLMSWCSPQAIGEYNIVIKMKEWRRSCSDSAYHMIGYVMRDMQMIVGSGSPVPFVPGDLTDTCFVSGNTLHRSLGSVSSFFSGAALYGVCAYGSQQSATAITNTVAGTYDFSWPLDCQLAKHLPQQVVAVYSHNDLSTGTSRYYQHFNVRVLPPAAQIYSVASTINTVTIRWHPAPGCSGNISGYNVYRKSGANSWTHGYCQPGLPAASGYSLVLIGSVNDSLYNDIYLQPFANGSNMSYIVTTVSSDCQEGVAENPQSVSLVVGIEQYAQEFLSTSVYPNPSENNFEISFGKILNSTLQITLYAADGRVVYDAQQKAPGSHVTLNGADLSAGIYLMRLQTTNGQAYRKLIKE